METGAWGGKRVWEMHAYSFTVNFPELDVGGGCEVAKAQYWAWSGFVLEEGRAWTGPLWVSEFGVGMTGGGRRMGGWGRGMRGV